jgi:protein-disulfide isomerase
VKKTIQLTLALGFACTLSAAFRAQTLNAQALAPAAPAPQPAATHAANPFPPVNPRNFTAASPTPAEVDSFLKQLWGYDENRIWQVAAIEKTQAPGVAKVIVFVDEKGQEGKGTQSIFYTMPDGKHAIASDVMDFGVTPFAEKKALLAAQADGPAHGAKSNALELVEFADLQCPRCKDAQDTMDQLATDFPEAKIVFENFPLQSQHPYAFQAATEGVCIRKAKGDEAFFLYAKAVFDTQGALTPDSHDATLLAAAEKAGADPAAAAACAKTPEAKADVEASFKLGQSIGVNATPTLVINGQLISIGQVQYETLKKIVAYRATMDGVTVHVQPTLSNIK